MIPAPKDGSVRPAPVDLGLSTTTAAHHVTTTTTTTTVFDYCQIYPGFHRCQRLVEGGWQIASDERMMVVVCAAFGAMRVADVVAVAVLFCVFVAVMVVVGVVALELAFGINNTANK